MSPPSLPLGAESPDEMLAASLDPALGDDDRQAVASWLDAHPEWQPRANTYAAITRATQRPVAGVGPPPDVATMTGLWAAIEQASRLASTPPAPPPPPAWPGPASPAIPLDRARAQRRRRSSSWLLAAAAALLIVGVGAVVVLTSGGDDTTDIARAPAASPVAETVAPGGAADEVDEASAEAPTPGVEAPSAPAALTRLRESAAVTEQAGTADVEFRMLATADVSGGIISEETGEDTVRFESVGIGQIDLAGRSILTTSTTTRVGDRTDFFPVEEAVMVRDGDRMWFRCEGEAEFTETAPDAETDCWATGVNPDTFGPNAALDAIRAESFATVSIVELGTDTLADGTVVTGYQTTEPLTLDSGEVTDVTMQVWVDDDEYVRRVVAGADFAAGDTGYPTNLVMSYDLYNLGTPVDIPNLD